MKITRSIFLVLLAALLFGVAPATVHAQSKEALAKRFKERLPAIDKLRQAGLVGENNQGYLEPRGNLSTEQGKTVEAENADRKALYEMISKQLGVSANVVGERRAVDIAKQARAGIWLQKPNGEWYRR